MVTSLSEIGLSGDIVASLVSIPASLRSFLLYSHALLALVRHRRAFLFISSDTGLLFTGLRSLSTDIFFFPILLIELYSNILRMFLEVVSTAFFVLNILLFLSL